MNAPALPGLQRKSYEPAVLALMPCTIEPELGLRCSLLLIRDRAMATKQHCSAEAWRVLDIVEQLAADHALRSMPTAELAELRRIMVMMVANASALEQVFKAPADG